MTTFSVNIGVLNASGGFASIQALRVGAPSVTVTVSHTNTAVGQLVTTSGPGQSRTVTIAAGQSNSPTTVAAGGVAFDPIGGGSTTVTATAGGLPGGATRDGNRERAGHDVAEPAGAGGRRSDDGRLRGAAGSHGARRRDGADHEQQPERAAGVAQHDDGGHAVRGYSGGERQHRRQFRHSGRGRGPGNGDADGDGTRFHAGAGHGDGR